jgi:hypothetical protein
MLGKSKTEWRCDCGSSNAEEVARCENCQTTAQGFKKGMVEPTKVIEILSRWLAVISGPAKTDRAGDA